MDGGGHRGFRGRGGPPGMGGPHRGRGGFDMRGRGGPGGMGMRGRGGPMGGPPRGGGGPMHRGGPRGFRGGPMRGGGGDRGGRNFTPVPQGPGPHPVPTIESRGPPQRGGFMNRGGPGGFRGRGGRGRGDMMHRGDRGGGRGGMPMRGGRGRGGHGGPPPGHGGPPPHGGPPSGPPAPRPPAAAPIPVQQHGGHHPPPFKRGGGPPPYAGGGPPKRGRFEGNRGRPAPYAQPHQGANGYNNGPQNPGYQSYEAPAPVQETYVQPAYSAPSTYQSNGYNANAGVAPAQTGYNPSYAGSYGYSTASTYDTNDYTSDGPYHNTVGAGGDAGYGAGEAYAAPAPVYDAYAQPQYAAPYQQTPAPAYATSYGEW